MSCELRDSPIEYSIEYFSIAGEITEYVLFTMTTPYFIYVKGTSFLKKTKNRLMFQLDVQ